MISNGFDIPTILSRLLGRISWRGNVNATYVIPFPHDQVYIVGTTSGVNPGATSFVDSSLTNCQISLELVGTGTMIYNTDYKRTNADDTVNDLGPKIVLLQPGDTFQAGEKYVAHVQSTTVAISSNMSGRYFEDFHPLVTLNNLKSVIEGGATMSNADWSVFLGEIEKSAILRVLNAIFNCSQQIDSTLIYDRQLRNDIPLGNNGKFTGFRLYTAPGDFALQISRASFIFTGAATFNLYAFHDMKKDPLYTQAVTTKDHEEVIVDLSNWIFNYIDANTQNGVFYVGYFQDDLGSVQALDEFVSRWNPSLAFGYTAFESPKITGQTDFQRISVPYTYRTCGMNLEIQTYKNFTNRIIKNASLFDEAIGLAMAIEVLGYQAYSVERSNRQERITKEMATKVYDDIKNLGNGMLNPWVAGLEKQMSREIARVRQNFIGDPGIITTRPHEVINNSLQGIFP